MQVSTTTLEMNAVNEEEFYRRFEEVVPGSHVSDVSDQIGLDIYFERLGMAGLEEMHRYSSDPRLYEFFEFGVFETVEHTKAYIDKLLLRMAGDRKNKTAIYWFVRRKVDDYLIGTAGLVDLHYARRSAEWGYAVDPDLWGTGYILQIQEALKHYAFEVLQLNRVDGITMVENIRTISSLLVTGMKHEGILRHFYCKDGVFHDGWQYGMIRADYIESLKNRKRGGGKFTVDDVVGIVSGVIADEEITVDSSMANVSRWDSLTHMSILVAISETIGITLSPLESSRATSVRAIASLLDARAGAASQNTFVNPATKETF